MSVDDPVRGDVSTKGIPPLLGGWKQAQGKMFDM